MALPLKHVFAITAYWRYQATLLPAFIKNQLGGDGKRIGIVYDSGPTAVGVTACCTNGKWTTPQPGWRATF